MFDNPEKIKKVNWFCLNAGSPDQILTRLQAIGTQAEMESWLAHLESCETCQTANQEEASLRATFRAYKSDPFFNRLSSEWQPDVSSLMSKNKGKPCLHSVPSARIYALAGKPENDGFLGNSQADVESDDFPEIFSMRKSSSGWPLGLVAGLGLVAVAGFLLMLLLGISGTGPEAVLELPTTRVELEWQVNGTSFGLTRPGGLALDGAGNLYVAEQYFYYIKKLDPMGQLLSRWGGLGSGNGEFNRPWGVAVDKQGYVYVTDINNHRIQKFDNTGRHVTSWGSEGSEPGNFKQPWGIGLDLQSNVYVVDSDNARIQKFNRNGDYLGSWGSYGRAKGQFIAPRGLAVDNQGNVYVTDESLDNIQKFDKAGKFLASWANPTAQPGLIGQLAGIAVDQQGNLYIVDGQKGLCFKINSAGKLQEVWGNQPGESLFKQPTGIAVDGVGNIFVTDSTTSLLLKFRQR